MKNKLQLVQQLYDAFAAGGRYFGAKTVLDEVFAKFRADWESWKAIVTEWLDAGETVIAIGEYQGTYRAIGQSMTAAFAHVYTLADDKTVRFRQFTDTRTIAGVMNRPV